MIFLSIIEESIEWKIFPAWNGRAWVALYQSALSYGKKMHAMHPREIDKDFLSSAT